MSAEFEAALVKIKGFSLATLGENAIKQGAILPLLKRVGWDTEDITEVKPEHPTDKGLVDYALRIDDTNRVFVEAKAGGVDLNFWEKQIEGYCRAGKPSLAVLTNGGHWWVYLPPTPTAKRGKKAELRRFIEFDIIADEPAEVERDFRQFLGRENLSSSQAVSKTLKGAETLYKEKQSELAVMKGLADAFNALASERKIKIEVLKLLTQESGIDPNDRLIEKFLREGGIDKLISPIPVKAKPLKPVGFSLSLGGEPPIHRCVKKSWKDLLTSVCLLMTQRHPEDFRHHFLEGMPGWFKESKSEFSKPSWPIGDTGIWVKSGSGKGVKQVCWTVVTKFGYPPGSLEIEEK